MTTSTSILDYLGRGLHAARPVSPPVASTGTAVYYETDTTHTFVWSGSGWQQVDIGSNAGSPPAIVQSGIDATGTASITLGGSPANGNLLIAMTFNPSVNGPGAGFTKQVENSSGTDFGDIYSKVCGAGESATQSPLSSSPGGTGLICMWELSGQAANFFVQGASQAEVTAGNNATPLIANISSMLSLAAISLVTSPTIVNMYNMTQDQISNSGNRRGVMGHSNASVACGQMVAAFSGSGNSKGAICQITA